MKKLLICLLLQFIFTTTIFATTSLPGELLDKPDSDKKIVKQEAQNQRNFISKNNQSFESKDELVSSEELNSEPNPVPIDFVNMINGGFFSGCDFYFTDNGGTSGNYPDNSNMTFTLYPWDTICNFLYLFGDYSIAANDTLFVYDGSNTSTLKFFLTNSTSTSTYTFQSNAANGALTFRFKSDGSGNAYGWSFHAECRNKTPVIDPIPDQITCGTNGTIYLYNYKHSANSNGLLDQYSWTNDNLATGFAASGNLSTFYFWPASNHTGGDLISNISVTVTNGYCVSNTETFAVTVKPSPILNTGLSTTICSGSTTSLILTNQNDPPGTETYDYFYSS